ncbi:MAG: hypothetical protein WDN50_08090 [Bradyrhizobium sp.]
MKLPTFENPIDPFGLGLWEPATPSDGGLKLASGILALTRIFPSFLVGVVSLQNLGLPRLPGCGGPFCFQNLEMMKFKTAGVSYGTLRKDCLEAVRQWPGCETVGGIQIIRDNSPAGFSVRITIYGEADKKRADRAMICVEREKRRYFYLLE